MSRKGKWWGREGYPISVPFFPAHQTMKKIKAQRNYKCEECKGNILAGDFYFSKHGHRKSCSLRCFEVLRPRYKARKIQTFYVYKLCDGCFVNMVKVSTISKNRHYCNEC